MRGRVSRALAPTTSSSSTLTLSRTIARLAVAEFANLPPQLLRLALQSLVAKGQAQIFQGSERGEGMEGVKFS